jgi:hypothetical protein
MWPFKKHMQDEPLDRQRDEIMNNSQLADVLQGECDTLPGSYGEFGRTPTNPIPVNGPRGEVKYLNRLAYGRNPYIFFHRIGSILPVLPLPGNVDVYEIVGPETNGWDLLYFHMYHPRRSTVCPPGYQMKRFHEVFSTIPLGTGTNTWCEIFPYDIPDQLEWITDEFTAVIVNKVREMVQQYPSLSRPTTHRQKLEELELVSSNTGVVRTNQASSPHVNAPQVQQVTCQKKSKRKIIPTLRRLAISWSYWGQTPFIDVFFISLYYTSHAKACA